MFKAAEFLKKFGKFMSLFQQPAQSFLGNLDSMLLERLNLTKEQIESLINRRNEARKAKDFKTSDEVRDQLTQMGISISDTALGTIWEVTK